MCHRNLGVHDQTLGRHHHVKTLHAFSSVGRYQPTLLADNFSAALVMKP